MICMEDSLSIEATPKDEILLEEMRRRYDLQQSEIDTADTKAGLLLAYLSAVFVMLVTSVPEVFTKIAQERQILVIIMASFSVLLYVVGAFCCVKSIKPRIFSFPMGVEETEVEFYLSQDRSNVILQLLRQYSEYTQHNIALVKDKSKWFSWSLVFSLAFTLAGACTAFLAHF